MHRVGIIPFKIEDAGISLLCVTSMTRGRWILPKGRLKAGEIHAEACHREGFEEAGARGRLLHDFPFTMAMHKTLDGGLIEVPVTYYPFLVLDLAERWDEQEQRRRCWVSIEAADETLAQPDHMVLVRQFRVLLPWILDAVNTLEP